MSNNFNVNDVAPAVVTQPLSQFGATTSDQLGGVLTDELGTGSFVRASALSTGIPLDPIITPNVIDDSLNTPPVSPVNGEAYIPGAAPTGVWASRATTTIDATTNTVTVNNATKTFTRTSGSFITDGHAVGDSVTTTNFTNAGNNATWKISALTALVMTVTTQAGGVPTLTDETNTTVANLSWVSSYAGHVMQWNSTSGAYTDVTGLAVSIGSRLGLAMEHGTVAGGFATKDDNIAVVTNATPGAYTYTFTAPVGSNAVVVNGANISDFGHQYTYDGTNLRWVETGLGGQNVATAVHIAATKTTPVDADEFGFVDSEAANILKKSTWASLKAALKTYFDTLYGALASLNVWSGTQRGAVTPLSSAAGSIAINLATTNNFSHTMTENTTLALPTNMVAGQTGSIIFTQHASAAKTLAFNAAWQEAATGVAPTMSTTLSAVNTLHYEVVSGTEVRYVYNKAGIA